MAAFRLHDKNPEDLSCVCGLVAPEVEGILLAANDQDRKVSEDELSSECDKLVLLEAREKIFGLAKAKVVRCMDDETMTKVFGDAAGKEMHDQTKTMESFVGQWKLVARRVEHRISSDIMDLLFFVLDCDAVFPSKVIKETSLNKGILSESVEEPSLNDKFRSDVAKKGNKSTTEVIKVTAGKQLCRISIDPSDRASSGGDSTSTPATDQSQVPKESGEQTAPEQQKTPDTQISSTSDANEASKKTTCALCGCAKPSEGKPVDRATSTDDLPKSSEECSKNTPTVKAKAVRSMATQTDKEESPILRTEFEYQSEYVEGKIASNERKLTDLNKWRNGAQCKIKEIDGARKENSKSIDGLTTMQNSTQSELEKYKESVEARFIAVFSMMDGKPATSGRDANGTDRADFGAAEGDDEDGNESVWDIPDEQSTPLETTVNRVANKIPTQVSANQGNMRARRLPPSSGRTAGNTRMASRATGNAVAGRGNDAPRSYKPNIEVIDDDSDAGMCTASSGSDRDAPDDKRLKYDGRGENTARVDNRIGRRNPPRQDRNMVRIEEEKCTDVDDDQQGDESWSDMVDEAEGYYSMDTTGTEGTRGQPGDGGQRGGGILLSNGDRRIVVPRSNSGAGRTDNNAHGELGIRDDGRGASGGSKVQTRSAATYAEAASDEDDWSIADGKGKKRKTVEKKPTHSFRGLRTISQREIYVQGIDYRGFSNHTAVEKEVKGFCKDKGVDILFIKVIPVKLDHNQVGCKIAVKEADFDTVMDERFWPEFVSVRAWVYCPREGRAQAGPNV